ncbi:sulfotransferase [Saprospiraceae bacterium]|nr:sulfotransferase [Saprospiraceae bacterium]
MISNSKSYLFICGCARSGTSIITELIRRDTRIAMGRERFNSLFKLDQLALNQSVFSQERFCKLLLEGDTHYTELNKYYNDVNDRWDDNIYYGDKIPSLFKGYEYLTETFDKPKVIFLLRNVFDVSHSWEKRRLHSIETNGKWPQNRGFKESVLEWNTSIRNTIKFVDNHPDQIFIIPYDRLFSDAQLLVDLFAFLDIEVTNTVKSFWETNVQRKVKLEQQRKINMPTEVKKHICLHADFDGYRTLNQSCL